MKIKVFIAEDEPNSLERLKNLILEFNEFLLIGEAKDGLSAIRKINDLRPELIFLDIQMPGANGFDVLSNLDYSPKTIFVTAYDQYAIKAFEENAVDYILKPISKDRLKKTLERISISDRDISEELILKLQESIKGENYLKRFIIKNGDEMFIYPEKDVFFFKSEDKYTFLYLKERRCIIDLTLKELENSLDPENFCRIHKNCIISLDKILKLKKWFHNDYIILMKDNDSSKLKVSRNYKQELMKKLS